MTEDPRLGNLETMEISLAHGFGDWEDRKHGGKVG
jgi:hypothetical protein